MNQRFLSVLAFAFVVALAASFLLYRVVTAHARAGKDQPKTASIAFATRNLPLGTVLKDSDVNMGPWLGTLPPGAVTKAEDVVGRGVLATIYQNEPVVLSRLAAKGGGGGLSALIPTGMRAVAVRVNEVVGVAGFVTPGMRVDVLVSGNAPGGNPTTGTITRTVLQNIEVLSAGQDFQKNSEGKPISVQVVNLLVTPEQAETLSLASHQTTIQLVLRNPLDREVAHTPGTALSRLLRTDADRPAAPPAVGPRPAPRPKPVSAPEPVKAPEPPPVTVEVIQGAKRNEVKFANKPEAW